MSRAPLTPRQLAELHRAVTLAIKLAAAHLGWPGVIVDVNLIPPVDREPNRIQVDVMPLAPEDVDEIFGKGGN